MNNKRLILVSFFSFVLAALFAKCEEKTIGAPKEKYDPVQNKTIKWCDKTQTTKCQCTADMGDSFENGKEKVGNNCVQMNLSLGRTRYSALTESVMLQLNELTPNSALYSPSGFKVVAGFALYSVSRDKNVSAVPKYVAITHPSGVIVDFVFSDNESVGMPRASLDDGADDRLLMVDAQGWATASDPAFYDYYPGDGSRWRFGASSASSDYMQLVEHQTPQGRIETAQDMGLEIIRDADGVLRQVKSAAWLADLVIRGQDAYDLAIYPNDATCVPGTRTVEGYFVIAAGAVADVVWEFRNPDLGVPKDLRVTKKKGSVSETWLYTYEEAVQDFTLVYPQGAKTDRLERNYSDDGGSFAITRTLSGADGGVFSTETKHYVNSSNGSLLTSVARDPGGLNLTTTYSCYSDGALDGLEKLTVFEDGAWIRYEYDNSRRKTAEISPWLDAPTNAPDNQCAVTRYGYGLFAPGDFLAYNDQRPRTVIKEICGVEVSRTYFAYPTNELGQAQAIEERAAFLGAPYGHASNPRTVKTYYASSAAIPLPGRLATITYPGGKTETYGYEYGTFNAVTFAFAVDQDGGAWRETVTTSYGANGGVQSLRSARVWDEKGREVLDESYVEDGAAFARIGWTRMTYDRNGKLTETAYSDGRVVSATWGANCCGKESETSADGIITVYGYNVLKQKVSETKKGFATDGSDDITTLYTYDLENRVLSTAITNVASRLGYVASRNAYDAVGRVTNAADRLGNSTVTDYDSLVTSVHRPNGVTTIMERYLDGNTKRVLENGVVKQSYTYGVTPDGIRWTLSADGSLPAITPLADVADLQPLTSGLDIPWQIQAADPLGRTVATSKPGFGRTVLVTSNAYDKAGNILSVTESSCKPDGTGTEWVKTLLYAYEDDGLRLFSALDLNTNGVIDVAGPDRIDGSVTAYEKTGDVWWRVSQSWVYPEFNSPAAVTTSVQRVQLTGLGAVRGDGGVLASHSEALDVRGNATVSESLVDRTTRRVTLVTALPTSVQPQIQLNVNGLLLETVSSTAVTNTFGYDVLGRLTSSTDGRGNTTVTVYSPQGLVDYTENAASNRTTYGYDTLGRRTSVTDALGNITHTQYDAEGRVTKTWGAVYPVEYGYDVQSRMVSMKTFRDENGQVDETRWFYENPTGLLTNKLYADGNGASYAYTANGKLASRLWARGILAYYSYDVSDALLSVEYSDSTPAITYTYDRLGNQLSAISSVSSNLFAFSPQTLDLVSETQNGTVITRATDALGRSSGVRFGDSYAVAYGYDDLGRFASVSSSVCFVPFGINYSRLPGTDLITGYTGTSPVSNFQFQVSKTYEHHRDLITSVSNHVNPVLISAYDYVNDALGRRVSRHDSGLAFAQSLTNVFGYNHRSEVTSAVMYTNAFGYVYDPIGNRLFSFLNSETNAYTSNPLNQYTLISQSAIPPINSFPSYDPDGNMTATGDGWHYVWNAENRLILASNAMHIVTYAYDHQGRMVSKAIDGTSSCYLWAGYNIVRETVPLNSLTNYYTWGLDLSGSLQNAGGVGGLLSVFEDGFQYFSMYDANGNISEYASTCDGIVAHYEYDCDGKVTVSSGVMADQFSFRFSSKYYDFITGLYYYDARFYLPKKGRWINRDLIGEEGGDNLYCFNGNNAVNSFDAYGEKIFPCNVCSHTNAERNKTKGRRGATYTARQFPHGMLACDSSQESQTKIVWSGDATCQIDVYFAKGIDPDEQVRRDRGHSRSSRQHENIHVSNFKDYYNQSVSIISGFVGSCACPPCTSAKMQYIDNWIMYFEMEKDQKDDALDCMDYNKNNSGSYCKSAERLKTNMANFLRNDLVRAENAMKKACGN